MKQIGLGILQYTQDYDEKFPLCVVSLVNPSTDGTPVGWADAIQTYLKSTQIYQCPSEPYPPSADPNTAGYTDYFINKNTSDGGQNLPSANNPTLTIQLGDGGSISTATSVNVNSNARYRSNGCATATANDMVRTSPVCGTTPVPTTAINLAGGGLRHFQGANYSFVDGHAKWLKNSGDNSSSIIWAGSSSFDDSGTNPTFHLKD